MIAARRLLSAAAAVLLAVGCAWAQPDDAAMFPLASAVTKLARAIDAYIASASPLPADTATLIEAATAHDPALREPFAGHHLSIAVDGRGSSVLVCSADRQQALIEDAGCTARLERQAWRESPPPPCRHTLDVATACGR